MFKPTPLRVQGNLCRTLQFQDNVWNQMTSNLKLFDAIPDQMRRR